MTTTFSRGLSAEFMADQLTRFLSPIRERVERDRSLCLEIRSDYIKVY